MKHYKRHTYSLTQQKSAAVGVESVAYLDLSPACQQGFAPTCPNSHQNCLPFLSSGVQVTHALPGRSHGALGEEQ